MEILPLGVSPSKHWRQKMWFDDVVKEPGITELAYFISKQPPLLIKICMTDSGRNVQGQGNVFKFNLHYIIGL